MIKQLTVAAAFLLSSIFSFSQTYQPTPENLQARQAFQDRKFGMFIHWGASSVLGAGEWVMQNRNIKVKDYKRLLQFFNPQQFDAATWVKTAKDAGMQYIVFITRHHDGFSNWDTKFSDWKITNTPYGKDVLRQLADECKKQNMKLGLYYSLLDWYRDDYPRETGRTGQGTGRTSKSDYASYLQFMKNQLTELLTNYGDIMSIWFDGHWDQTNVEGSADMSARIDWKYNEIYSLIHKLQPNCLIGNNHHLQPMNGEDFQMFEKDLPGQNNNGLSFQKVSEALPLETCETINHSWGYNITDNSYKSVKTLVQYLVKAASYNANFLLNIGPMPNGAIQSEFTDSLKAVGEWMQKNGESIYGTRGLILPEQEWGVVTKKDKKCYLHILKSNYNKTYLFLPQFTTAVKSVKVFDDKRELKFKQQKEGTFIYTAGLPLKDIDTIIEMELK